MDPKLLAKELGVVDGLRATHDGPAHLAERNLHATLIAAEPGTRIWMIDGGKRWLLERPAGTGFWDLLIFNRRPTVSAGTWAIWLLRAWRRGARLYLREAVAR